MMDCSESFKPNVLDKSDGDKVVNGAKMKYNYEVKRLQSFQSWPVHYPIDPVRLAKSGFFYEGKADEVTCFSCHGKINDWQFGDIVQKKHTQLFPDCDFINKRSNNVTANCSKLKSDKILEKSANIKPVKNLHSDIVENSDCSDIVNERKSNADQKCSNVPNYEKMKSEIERLKTFSIGWPLPFLNVLDVVKAGFFYLGYGDKVQCPFCKGIVSNWDDGDNPLKEHAKHFPWCDYLQNIGYTKIRNKNPWYEKTGYDTCGGLENNSLNVSIMKCRLLDKDQSINLKQLGVHLYNGPIHPQQAPFAARIRSFLAWPSTAPVFKEDLAQAGFFYIGISDHTKCFHCDGGLCNWEQGDDPWVEHARWFPRCDFLRLNKGEEFIDSFKVSKISDTTAQSISMNESLMGKVDEAMKSNLVTHILESNIFPSSIVRIAVLKQIKETGYSFVNVDEICKAVAYLTEEMKPEQQKMTNDSIQNQVLNISTNDLATEATSSANTLLEVNSASTPCKRETVLEHSVGTSSEEENSVKLCTVCMDKEVGIVFLPCGHLLACTLCAPALNNCPVCRKTILGTVRAYLP